MHKIAQFKKKNRLLRVDERFLHQNDQNIELCVRSFLPKNVQSKHFHWLSEREEVIRRLQAQPIRRPLSELYGALRNTHRNTICVESSTRCFETITFIVFSAIKRWENAIRIHPMQRRRGNFVVSSGQTHRLPRSLGEKKFNKAT